jgi:hypothetical protein
MAEVLAALVVADLPDIRAAHYQPNAGKIKCYEHI